MSTLLTHEGRNDVVVLLDRAIGARREGREGRHHDLRHRRVDRPGPAPLAAPKIEHAYDLTTPRGKLTLLDWGSRAGEGGLH